MATAGYITDSHNFSPRPSGSVSSNRSPLPWTMNHWLLAMLPGTFFGITNFAQNAAIAGGFSGVVQFVASLLVFLVGYNFFALILRTASAAVARSGAGSELGGKALLIHLAAIGAGGTLHLLGIATLTAAVREAGPWQESVQPYFVEIVASCAPIWIFVYAVSMVALSRLSHLTARGAKPAAADRVELRVDGTSRFVDPREIIALEAEGNYVGVVTSKGRLLVRSSLGAMEAELSKAGFIRTHRSAVANRSLIREIGRSRTGAYHARLADGTRLPVSRRQLAAVRQSLAGEATDETVVTDS